MHAAQRQYLLRWPSCLLHRHVEPWPLSQYAQNLMALLVLMSLRLWIAQVNAWFVIHSCPPSQHGSMNPHLVQRKCWRSSCIGSPQLGQSKLVLAGDEWVVDIGSPQVLAISKGGYVAFDHTDTTVFAFVLHATGISPYS